MKPSCYYVSVPPEAVEIPGFPNNFATPSGEIFSVYGLPKRRRYGRNSCGYPICGLTYAPTQKKFVMVHRIIALMFVPGDHSLEVNHKDMNKLNCAACNLEWVTHPANHLHGHANKPDWGKKIGVSLSRAVVATNPATGARQQFASGRLAAAWIGNPKAAGNISKACRHGRLAYGFYWAKDGGRRRRVNAFA